MHVVAIVSLSTTIDEEAAALAVDLGTTAYEERLKLARGLPVIVLTSADPSRSDRLCAALLARGQGAVTCDASDVVPSSAMVAVRSFAFETSALTLPNVAGARLPYDDILALLRASHQTHTETRTETKSKELSAGRAILSGGLMLRKTVTRDEKSVSSEREQVLYLIRRDGGTPWILRERSAHYGGLGAHAGPSSAQNFLATVAELRRAAPGAAYDERLMSGRSTPSRTVRTAGSGSESLAVSSASGVDLMVHLLAMWIRGSRRP